MEKRNQTERAGTRRFRFLLFGLLGLMMLSSCASVDPREADVALPTTPPRAKVTTFTESLSRLGLMTEVYDTATVKIQSNPIGDETGTSVSTGGEIPRDITEMMKSSLNTIGGNVVFIPYDPAFIQNQIVTGYSNFANKYIPDIVLSGGITEFDRGLSTRSRNSDIAASAELKGMPNWLPSKEVRARYDDGGKEGLARITLDFNLVDFETMAGLPQMSAVNTMEVHKALREKELAISLFGITFGGRGSIKKVEGRHAAIRLLVELSAIQVVGKYLALPYWRLLGDDAVPDKNVLRTVERYYASLSDAERIADVQRWLYLYGYDVDVSGVLDARTRAALKDFEGDGQHKGDSVDSETFRKIYVNIPLTTASLGRRHELARLTEPVDTADEMAAEVPVETVPSPVEAHVAPADNAAASESRPAEAEPARAPSTEKKAAATRPAPRPKARRVGTGNRTTIGRMLTEDEW